MEPKIVGIGCYEKGAEDIDETIITIAVVRTHYEGAVNHTNTSIYGQHDNRPWNQKKIESAAVKYML